MALVEGTNCGFVTAAPTEDPEGVGNAQIDSFMWSGRFVAPSGATKVTEIGWWCDTAGTSNVDTDIGIYDHNVGDGEPENRLGFATIEKGTTAGWKKVTGLNIAVTPGETYWLAFQLDDTSPNTYVKLTANAAYKGAYKNGSATSLPDPWGTSDSILGYIVPVYAVYEVGGVEHTHFSTDTMSISDSVSAAMTFNVPLSDTLGIGDSLATPVMTFNVALADTLSISDTLTSAIMQFNVALSDQMNISDSLLAAATYNVALTDKMNISDSLAVAAAYAVALADTMGISDSLAAGWVFYVSLTDQMEISDSLSVEEIEAVIRRIRRGQIYGFKPARVVKVGRVGV